MSQRGRGRRKLCVARKSSHIHKPSPMFPPGRKSSPKGDCNVSTSLTSKIAKVLSEATTKSEPDLSVPNEQLFVDNLLATTGTADCSLYTDTIAQECAHGCKLETCGTPPVSGKQCTGSVSLVDTNIVSEKESCKRSHDVCGAYEVQVIPEADSWVDLLNKIEAEAQVPPAESTAASSLACKAITGEDHAMRLFPDDMPVFGQFPLFDTLLTVRCRHCDDVFKESAFVSHMVRYHADRLSPQQAGKFAHLAVPPIGLAPMQPVVKKRKKHSFIYALKRTRATRGLLEANNIPAEAITDSDRDSDVDKDTDALLHDHAHAYGCVCTPASCTCMPVRVMAVRKKRLKYDEDGWIPRRQSSRLQTQVKPRGVLR